MASGAEHLGIFQPKELLRASPSSLCLCHSFGNVFCSTLRYLEWQWNHGAQKGEASHHLREWLGNGRWRRWRAEFPPGKDFQDLKNQNSPQCSPYLSIKIKLVSFLSRLRDATQADCSISEVICGVGNPDSDASRAITSAHLGCWLLCLCS